MIGKVLNTGLFIAVFLLLVNPLPAQDPHKQTDTFFLAKKRGLLGRIGKSMSTNPVDETVLKLENPFLKYRGKIIRSITTIRLGFEYNFEDTGIVKNNFATAAGKSLHKNTTDAVIRNNLFFKEGDRLFPLLLADNERYLRELTYIRDARIQVEYSKGSRDSVDVVVITKDVFSIGGKLLISSKDRGRGEIREENLLGSGSQLLFSGYHENRRSPQTGVGGEFTRRNIAGSFIDWVSGYQDYKYAFTSGRNQETVIYTRFEKPLVTPYIPSTGAIEWSYQRTRNVYDSDSLYHSDYRYASYNIDGWFGYSLDSKKALYSNREIRIHRFVAIRGFMQHFLTVPLKNKSAIDYRFADYTGALASLNVFRQTFYKTNFIYGFGRNEDVPEGFNMALSGGYVNNQSVKRPYAGIDFSIAHFTQKAFYSNYTLRVGGYFFRRRFEDVDLLFSVDHFSRLKKMSKSWYHRLFIATSITAQANPVLNVPLFLTSDYGLPYFNNGTISADLRATVKGETVFYNTTRVLGFRFAPFAFADMSLVKPTKLALNKSDFYSALGGGIRTRNENLVYGTIELRAYYFPRLSGDMKSWKVELNSNIRFKYKSSFINRPGFINAN